MAAETRHAAKNANNSKFIVSLYFYLIFPRNTESSEKRFRMNSFVADFGRPLESERVFSRQIAEESRSLFHFCINEVEHLDKAQQSQKGPDLESNIHFQEVSRSSGTLEEDLNCLAKYNIPNFVNTEQNSSLGEGDLLILQPPRVLESKTAMQSSHRILDWKFLKVKIPVFVRLEALLHLLPYLVEGISGMCFFLLYVRMAVLTEQSTW